MYPADSSRTNPTPSHFARNTPVELHPPVSSRLLHQRHVPQTPVSVSAAQAPSWTRHLDREGRAICRIVYAHGLGIQFIASVFCVSEETAIRAIENKPSSEEHDKAENDYYYVNNEYRNQYPPLPKPGERRRPVESTAIDSEPQKKGQPKAASSGKNSDSSTKQPRSSGSNGNVSGPANNPTCRHFKDNLPVAKIGGSNSQSPRLDRKGRAICRIMHPYIGNYTKIAVIFGITHNRVRKAVLNEYAPPDNVDEDYDVAGQEFMDEYPPISDKLESRAQDSGKRQKSPELDEVPNKRAKRDEYRSQPATTTNRKIVVEVPGRAKADAGAAGIRSFLKNIGGFDLSHWQETFKEKGLCDMGDLSTLANLEESKLVKTLTRLFADQKMAQVHILLLADALLDLANDVAEVE